MVYFSESRAPKGGGERVRIKVHDENCNEFGCSHDLMIGIPILFIAGLLSFLIFVSLFNWAICDKNIATFQPLKLACWLTSKKELK